jgi:hypothetical protein
MTDSERTSNLNAALAHINAADRLGCVRAIGRLAEVINDGETLITGVPGELKSEGMGLLLLTDRRLAFVHTGILWGLKIIDFPLRAIGSIDSSTGVIFGEVTVTASGAKQTIAKIPKRYVADFATKAREAWTPNTAPQPAGGTKSGDIGTDFTTAIGRLVDMKSAGHLTDEEFSLAKQRVLQGLS